MQKCSQVRRLNSKYSFLTHPNNLKKVSDYEEDDERQSEDQVLLANSTVRESVESLWIEEGKEIKAPLFWSSATYFRVEKNFDFFRVVLMEEKKKKEEASSDWNSSSDDTGAFLDAIDFARGGYQDLDEAFFGYY